MHWLSQNNRSEFLACPQLIRFDYAKGRDGFEPTLLLKGSTLLLKYVILGVPMQLAFAQCEDRLLCAVKVCDDGKDGAILWSVVEREEELNGIRGLARGEPLVAFLFNEIAVNVAWNDWPASGTLDRLLAWADRTKLGHIDQAEVAGLTRPMLSALHRSAESDGDWLVMEIGGRSDWKPVQNHFITASASASLIDLFDRDEGNQQEQISVWLTDNLQSSGVHHSPQIPKGQGTRELTDVLLTHEFGSVLIESKTLSVLARERLPDREKLKRDVSAHINKAFGQLRGAIRALKSGTIVTNRTGIVLSLDRESPAHAIVLIPELDLIDDQAVYGLEFMKDFISATGGFPHLLDLSELLRVVQAAEMIAALDENATPLMAFDYYLMQRTEKALAAGTLCIEVLLRIGADSAGE